MTNSFRAHPRPRTALAAAFALLFLLAPAASARPHPSGKAEKIDEVLSAANRYGMFNGAVLVAENGRVIYTKGLGQANMEWGIPNAPDTRFRLGSITKQFTAAAVMLLVRDGKISLDGTVSDYLPDYRKDTGSKVTIRHLLTHTSGIPSYTSQPGFFKKVSRDPYSVDDFVKQHASGDLEFEPGTRWVYNNSGYFLLGAVIERVSGMSYEKFLGERIFAPLGMKSTGYDHFDAILPKRATGYQSTPSGYVNAPYLDMSIPYAAGSLYSTVEDLYLWDQALYTDRLLPEADRKVMFTPVMNNYAFGWGVSKEKLADVREVTTVSHGGGINGFNTLITRLVDDRHLVVLLDNGSHGASLGPLTKAITNILYGLPYEMPKQGIGAALAPVALERGGAAAVARYRELKASKPGDFNFGEAELNQLGYTLLERGKTADAIEIFKLNVEAHPKAANPYDSLGEAYLAAGNKELAIVNYRKSLDLNPGNQGAATKLKELTGEAPKEVKVDPKIYDGYVGSYRLAPDFVLTVRRDGDRLMSQATNQPEFEIFPKSETVFYPKAFAAQVEFFRGADGKVTHLVLKQGGREMNAPKFE